jgi:hypothetical protein
LIMLVPRQGSYNVQKVSFKREKKLYIQLLFMKLMLLTAELKVS